MMTMTATKTTTKTAKSLHNGMAEIDNMRAEAAQRAEVLAQLASKLEADAAALRQQANLARGTREIPLTVQAPAPEHPLTAPTVALLIDKPHTWRDLCAALGVKKADENSLKGVLVRIQRSGLHRVVNLGTSARAIWWIDAHDRLGEIAEGGPATRILSAKK